VYFPAADPQKIRTYSGANEHEAELGEPAGLNCLRNLKPEVQRFVRGRSVTQTQTALSRKKQATRLHFPPLTCLQEDRKVIQKGAQLSSKRWHIESLRESDELGGPRE